MLPGRTRHDRTPKVDESPYNLVLLAENEEGYKNLLKLSSISHVERVLLPPAGGPGGTRRLFLGADRPSAPG